MQVGPATKLKSLFSNWTFLLLLVTALAIFLRSLPAWTNAAWGCDFGIYYGLTNSFVQNGELFNEYYGWGGSYQYFPVLYAITGVAHWVTGIDVLIIMPKVAPIFGGLSIMVFYFVVRELIGNKKIAMLSSLFLAVLPFHVYQTSHASPLTMGHFFMILSIY
ncbi:MAG: dolichyl-phosphate-mannose--protein mannosyltransferase, partial [Candidatus Thermoplasmatota archaeon]|nr:dolichyl-phosphate-mannose--protein mannosyltransferase [Candidatus Thermoplasmatota archaeon]